MNRIEQSISQCEKLLSKLPEVSVKAADKSARVETGYELGVYQQTQAEAFASGWLNQEEAQSLYNILGCGFPTIEKFNRQSLAVRIVAMKTVAELMRANHATA